MNDFLSAEERLRLKCVFLHSYYTSYQETYDKEMSKEEVAFVLGITAYRVTIIEDNAPRKIKRRLSWIKQVLE